METREGTLLETGAKTTTQTSEPISSGGCKYLVIVVDVTAGTGGSAITPSVEVQDRVSKAWKSIWTAALAFDSTVATYAYALGPGLLAAVKGDYTDVENVVVPPTFRVKFSVADTKSVTYSASYQLTG